MSKGLKPQTRSQKHIARSPFQDGKQEAAILLHAYRDFNRAKTKQEKDLSASLLALRMNETPYYQSQFGIGGDSGRKVIGFSNVPTKGGPSFTPIIRNSKTGTTGPMTKNASNDPQDEVLHLSIDQLTQYVRGA